MYLATSVTLTTYCAKPTYQMNVALPHNCLICKNFISANLIYKEPNIPSINDVTPDGEGGGR